MYLKSKKSTTGQELWKKAKKVIQGGNMLLSKNPDNFLPQSGLHITIKLKVVRFGIWMIIVMLI